MKRTQLPRLTPALWAAALLVFLAPAIPARAGYPDECAGSADLGLANTVGVPDVGFMIGGEPTVPKEMVIYRFTGVLGEYSLHRYFDGDGLIRPTDAMPVWLATVDGPGTYLIISDGEGCVVTVETAVASPPSESPSPSSDPGAPQDDNNTIQIPKNVALTGIGALAFFVLVGLMIRRRRL